MSCVVGGGTQRVAKAMNNGLGRVFRDIGVKCAAELAGLSAMSAHWPGDMVAEPMPLPESADAGGSHQWTMDRTMAYFNATTALLSSIGGTQRPQPQPPAAATAATAPATTITTTTPAYVTTALEAQVYGCEPLPTRLPRQALKHLISPPGILLH
jgi:hypothetical protein